MQTTKQYLANSRVAEAERAEAEAWLRRQERWERRLSELRRPRPVGRRVRVERRPAA